MASSVVRPPRSFFRAEDLVAPPQSVFGSVVAEVSGWTTRRSRISRGEGWARTPPALVDLFLNGALGGAVTGQDRV